MADVVFRMDPFGPSFLKLGHTFFIISKKCFSKTAPSFDSNSYEQAICSLKGSQAKLGGILWAGFVDTQGTLNFFKFILCGY